ncbi:hypothetical protein GCM10017620_33050 [Brevundimonas intermedia]|uniref:Uncharacterized protein n=1 Tax=Brevundimonas intermedia TaxID=74315 RepID=A0ABQ5TCM8_9CAUL|nr:hypothetical protein [Brevundimonas intermedia]GLK50331.1 hypothetical protein GCM10017620_33050 [Brevundimonas intermedia]
MLIAGLLAAMVMTVSDGDPDGVVATAPSNAPTLAEAMNAPPEAAAAAPTAQDAQPHGLTTEQQIQHWLDSRTPGANFDEAASPGPRDDRQVHGMVEAGIGTGGYRSYGAAVSMPIGDNGRLDLAYREGRNEPWGYGYGGAYGLRGPGFHSPYGAARGYGVDSTSKSLSLGFSWSKDEKADERDPWRRGLSAYD